MQTSKATGRHRKSGGAQWRDLRFSGPFLGMFFDRANPTNEWPDRTFTRAERAIMGCVPSGHHFPKRLPVLGLPST
jgi:hypothetical protein